MFEKTAAHITMWMDRNGIIESDKITVVQWGLRNILDTTLNFITFIIIGLLLRMPLETIVFTLGYIPLRSFAGGFHAKTPLRCWIVSNTILFTALMIVRYLSAYPLIMLILAFLSILILIILMPVSDIHKPLDRLDIRRYKARGLCILAIEIGISFFFKVINQCQFTYSIFVIWILLSIMLIFGKSKNKFNQKFS